MVNMSMESYSLPHDRFKQRSGHGKILDQVDLFEINGALATEPVLAIRKLGINKNRGNLNCGAVAPGHPIGAGWDRLVATLLCEMQSRQAGYGVASFCIGRGETVAAVSEPCQ